MWFVEMAEPWLIEIILCDNQAECIVHLVNDTYTSYNNTKQVGMGKGHGLVIFGSVGQFQVTSIILRDFTQECRINLSLALI